MTLKIAIGQRLKEERLRVCLSQSAIANCACTTQNTQYLYETGKRTPDALYLWAVASCGVDIFYVLFGERAVNQSISSNEALLLLDFRRSPASVQKGVYKLLEETRLVHEKETSSGA